jgi:hypothetical protein
MPGKKSLCITIPWGFLAMNILLNLIVIYLLLQGIGEIAKRNQPLQLWNTGGKISEDRIHDAEFERPNSKIWFTASNVNLQSSGVQLLVSGFRLLSSSFWFLVSGCWRLISDYWYQVSGLWLLNSF